GRASAGGALLQFLKPALRPDADFLAVVRRGVGVWSRLFDFGGWKASPLQNGKVELKLTEVDPISRAVRLWLAGLVEQTLRAATASEIDCVVVGGELSFTPELVFELVR